jgi:hypothetical protein
MIVYRFKITYASKKMQQISEFLKKCNLGDKEFAIQETYEITTKDDHPVDKIKKGLTWAFEQTEAKVFEIKGGKIE